MYACMHVCMYVVRSPCNGRSSTSSRTFSKNLQMSQGEEALNSEPQSPILGNSEDEFRYE